VAELRSFDDRLVFGAEGEHIVARWLMRLGAVVSPLYQYTEHGKAPVVLWTADGKTISRIHPDLACWKDGASYFVEVKRKRQWTRDPDQPERGEETGFDQRLFDHYAEIAARTGAKLYVFFLHEQQPPMGLFFAEISRLSRDVRRWNGKHNRSGKTISPPMALFPRSALRDVGPVAA